MYTGIMLLILFATLAMLVREGLWSNTITLFNVLIAALVATNYFEPLADWLDEMIPTFTYLVDFLALWIGFCVAYIVLRAATDQLSKVQVRFKQPVNIAGGSFMALWTGWVLVCFVSMSLHTAPLARDFLGGAVSPDPNASTLLGFSPDRQWLAFVHQVSDGSLATADPGGGEGSNVFDPQAEFVYKYGQRRANFEKEPEFRVRRD